MRNYFISFIAWVFILGCGSKDSVLNINNLDGTYTSSVVVTVGTIKMFTASGEITDPKAIDNYIDRFNAYNDSSFIRNKNSYSIPQGKYSFRIVKDSVISSSSEFYPVIEGAIIDKTNQEIWVKMPYLSQPYDVRTLNIYDSVTFNKYTQVQTLFSTSGFFALITPAKKFDIINDRLCISLYPVIITSGTDGLQSSALYLYAVNWTTFDFKQTLLSEGDTIAYQEKRIEFTKKH